MGGLVDVVDDLAEVLLEVALGKTLQVGECFGGSGNFAAGERKSCFFFITGFIPHKLGGFSDVDGENDQVEVLVDVVHDLGLQEYLRGVVHDLVTQLGLGDVLSQMFDTGATTLCWTIFINDFITFPLSSLSIRDDSNQLFDDFKVASEK